MSKINIVWRVLETWPTNRPSTSVDNRLSGGQFKAPISQTLGELEEELDRIDAKNSVVEISMDRRDLRVTGEPSARSSTLTTPGLVLHFTDRRGQSITMPCDRYDTWQANCRALLLTLRALRAVDRYGATASGEQYRGWTALPATTTPAFTVDQAAGFLSRMSGLGADVIARDKDIAKEAIRVAAARTHPDAGGSTGNFQLVQESKRVLSAHLGVAL